MKTSKKRVIAIAAAAAMLVSMTATFTACSSDTASKAEDTASAAASTVDSAKDAASQAASKVEEAADTGDAGFTEIPIFEDEELAFMNVSAVYFQPVPMSAGASVKEQKAEDYDIHLEADISALENDLGYPKDSWVPYLTVDYKIVDPATKEVAAEGTFMEMAASDGPHYGSNIKLPKAGTYELTITIHSPADNDYLIHLDSVTGPGGTLDKYFKDGPLSATQTWEYAGPVTV